MGQGNEGHAGRRKNHRRHPVEPRRLAGWKARRKENMAKLIQYLQHHPCIDCRVPDFEVLEFDHIRGTKVASISAMVHAGRPWSEVQDEIHKCEVRCANCHKKRHAREGLFFMYRQSLALLDPPEGC